MSECTVKKVGDLIQEKNHPEYGKALIVKVGDRRQTVCYQVLMYGEHKCVLVGKRLHRM